MNFNDYQKAIIERLVEDHGQIARISEAGDRSTEKVIIFEDGFEWLAGIDRHTTDQDSFSSQFNSEVWVIWDSEWNEFVDDFFQFDNEFDAEICAWETARMRFDDSTVIKSMTI